MKSSVSETTWLLSCLTAFLVINVMTASLSPTVWMDEVMYTDPAVNLRLDGRFTSTAWYAQRADEFWSGNVPLHSLLLAGWLSFAPVNPAGVRSMNYVLVVLATVAFWLALKRSEFIRTAAARLLFVVTSLCGYGVGFSFRSGRPDSLGILVCGLLTLALTLKSPLVRQSLVILFAALLPWTGLQLMVLACVALTLDALVSRRVRWVHVGVVVGLTAGVALLLSLYATMGTLEAFFASVRPHTATYLENGQTAWSPSQLTQIYKDYSLMLLMPLLAALPFLARSEKPDDTHFLYLSSLGVVAIPPILTLVGKFPIYYSWMSAIPMCAVTAHILERATFSRVWVRVIVAGLVSASIACGLPARIAVSLLESSARNYTSVSNYVSSVVRIDDIAFIDYQAYYPARLIAKKVILPTYLEIMSPSERESVTVAVVSIFDRSSDDAADLLRDQFGDRWVPISSPLTAQLNEPAEPLKWPYLRTARPYELAAFRRDVK